MATKEPPVTPRTLLRREESYAIHALVYVAENPGSPASQVAADLQIPPAFLAKVLRRLAKVGYVKNRQGRNGGVTLVVDPNELTLLDVMEAVSGPVIMDTCQMKEHCATQQRKGYCRVNVCWFLTTAGVRDVLSGMRIGQLIDDPVGAEQIGGPRRPSGRSKLAPAPVTAPATGS